MSASLKIKHYTLLLLLLLISSVTVPASAERPADVNPVYIGALLVDEPGLEDMANLCRYYGFTEQASSNSGTNSSSDLSGTSLSNNTNTGINGHKTYYTRANTLRPSSKSQNAIQSNEARPSSDERIFTRPDGSEIRFRVTVSKGYQTPVVEIRNNTSLEQLKKDLESIRFKRSKQAPNQYYRGTTLANRHSVATLTGDRTSGVVTFTKQNIR